MGDFIDKIANRAGGKTKAAAPESSYGGVKQRALDDLAAALKVPKEAREDFDGALVDLISACMKDKKAPKAAPAEEEAEESEPPADSEE